MRTINCANLLARQTLLAMAISVPLSAAHAQDEESELLEALSEETAIATRSKQNADYVPGVVSVLQAQDVMALGKRTVLDALMLIPGIEANRDADGNATLRVRGLDFFFNSGNVKVLVDGLDMAAEVSASNSAVLLMSLRQVERIEVIRGPGSNLYGDFAFTGLVNIVTRRESEGGAVALGVGPGGQQATLTAAHRFEHLDLGINLSDLRADRFQSVGQTPPDERRRFGNLLLEGAGFSFKASLLDRDSQRLVPAPNAPPRVNRRFEHIHNLALEKQWELDDGSQWLASVSRQDADSQAGNARYQGREWRYAISGNKSFGAHLLLAEVSRLEQNIELGDFPAAPPPPGQPANPAVFVRDRKRTLNSIMVQDQVELSESVTATVGARFDALEDIDSRLTPRAALVWRINDRHTLKGQYAEGFRTPTTVELYSRGNMIANGELDLERIRTAEASYVYANEKDNFRATLFSAEVPNAILRSPVTMPGHFNGAGPESSGVELEWEHQWSDRLQLAGTYAFARSKDPRGQPQGRLGPGFGAARHIFNVTTLFKPLPNWEVGAHYLLIGDRDTSPTKTDGYGQLDAAITRRIGDDFELSFNVRNLLKADVSYLARVPPGRLVVADYSERSGQFELVWRF
jgi:iron complex outermembrane receptor protein